MHPQQDDHYDRLSSLFRSLANSPRAWVLTRTLRSDNPKDINGVLTGTAEFQIQEPPRDDGDLQLKIEMAYRECGEMPMFGPGLRWMKKYIWRLAADGQGRSEISVWFVKVDRKKKNGEERRKQGREGSNHDDDDDEEEADYLFHTFDLDGNTQQESEAVSPPDPPLCSCEEDMTTVIVARGNHLCVNDMYHTAYAFRTLATGEVVSWSSRHLVKGPNKSQDISNVYEKKPS